MRMGPPPLMGGRGGFGRRGPPPPPGKTFLEMAIVLTVHKVHGIE